MTYTWQNLEAYVDVSQASCCASLHKRSPPPLKHILNNGNQLNFKVKLSYCICHLCHLAVSGIAYQGELLAIMGASGAGKTTLLNCLTFRSTGKMKVVGERCVNGVPADPDSLARISAYVQQDDLFVGTLTVREHIRFQALLRMDKHLSYAERMIRVDEVIQQVGLTKCADTRIGDPERGVKGISGGERRRLSFATEVTVI